MGLQDENGHYQRYAADPLYRLETDWSGGSDDSDEAADIANLAEKLRHETSIPDLSKTGDAVIGAQTDNLRTEDKVLQADLFEKWYKASKAAEAAIEGEWEKGPEPTALPTSRTELDFRIANSHFDDLDQLVHAVLRGFKTGEWHICEVRAILADITQKAAKLNEFLKEYDV